MPNLLPATRIVDGLAYLKRLFQRLLVHPGQHQGLLGLGVDRNGGDKAFGIELGAKLVCFVDWGGILRGKGDRFRLVLIAHGFDVGRGA